MPIPFPEEMDHRTLAHRLMRATERVPAPCFRFKQGRLHAAEIVGCIQLGRLRINILPKVDTPEPRRDRDFLLNMMWAAGYLNQPHTGSADVRSSSRDPLEALISELASEMSSALLEGIPRRYEEKYEELPTVRGRIDFSRLSTRSPCDRILLPVRYTPLHSSNQLTRCIKGIAALLHRLTRSSSNRQTFTSILAQLNGVESRPLTLSQLDELQLTRLESHWIRSVSTARLLLVGQSPDPTFAGNNQAFSLLFPLQHLFERAMRRILGAALSESGVAVSYRSMPHFLLQDPSDGNGVVRLRPDYILGPFETPLAVADAKWKRTSEFGRTHGVNREDLYQMSTYLARFNVRDALIFFPQAGWMHESWSKSYDVPGAYGRVHLIGVNIEELVARNQTIRAQAHAALSATVGRILAVPA
ncbi:McrC family protein [Burkholderia gladioli]|uniref:McrC family protein n=1 Tax=Burkholderia gladioli TaxID=28095 RepID=UPI003FA54245